MENIIILHGLPWKKASPHIEEGDMEIPKMGIQISLVSTIIQQQLLLGVYLNQEETF